MPTARDIAIVLLAVTDTDAKRPTADTRWAQGYMDAEENSEHSGDCKKQPWTCSRCVLDEEKIRGAAALPLLEALFSK